MAIKNAASEIARHRVYQILITVGPLVTLMVNPWTSYDPIGLPKMLVLCAFATSLGFLLYSRRRELLTKISSQLWILFISFEIWMILVLLFSGSPFKQQFWGSFGRNTGFLTYTSLLLILISAAILSGRDYYAKLIKALISTALPMTAYCLVQMSGKDPIGWSEFATFGTLGNVNFLSAFFGMSSIACLGIALNRNSNLVSRLTLVFLGILDIYIAYTTGSIQGVVIFVAGLFTLIAIKIYYMEKKKRLLSWILFFLTVIPSVILGVLGLVNKGFLAKYLYQPSVLFRADYIHAGWEMTMSKPIFGVGLDSYGDWYREKRGEISTLRTGVDRISNSAHNIFLDISSNGGVVLGVSFILMMLVAALGAYRYLRSQKNFDPFFAAIFSVWLAYQVQALVSINQIGVGIWGWLLTGVLIGYGELAKRAIDSQENLSENMKSKSKKFRGAQLSARDAIFTFVGFVLGIVIAAPPLSADIAYRTANASGDITRLMNAVNRLGATQFHKELALDFALRTNQQSEVPILAKELVGEYPRSFFGWRVLSVLTASTPEEREQALLKVRSLDPFNPELR